MSKFLWTQVTKNPGKHDVWHIIVEVTDQTKTMCGLFVPQEAWDACRDELGNGRPCDNCAEIAAVHEDAGDQPAVV